MNLEILKHAKDYIEKMANGINPLTGKTVNENDMINNIKISRCLFYVNSVLGEVLANGGIGNNKVKTKKLPFYLDKELIDKYEISEDLSISKIVKKINELKPNGDMSDLKITDMCNWLVSLGLLVEEDLYGKKVKKPTDSGRNIGMYTEHRYGAYGEYDLVLYGKTAQEFIINNFSELLDFINKKKETTR